MNRAGPLSPIGRLALVAVSLLVICLVWSCNAAAAGEVTTVTDLVDRMKEYDGKTVEIQGEVIGDRMIRGGYSWVTVNDDPYSVKNIEEGGEPVGMSNAGIGVWVPDGDASSIEIYGGFKNKGDRVRVVGTFHRACHEHGGDPDIHAEKLELIKRGHAIRHGLSYGKLTALMALLGVAVLLWMFKKRVIAREERRQ